MFVNFRCITRTMKSFDATVLKPNISRTFLQCAQKSHAAGVLVNRLEQNLKMNTEELHANETFSFMDYDCIGFDLDNTICRYKISNMVKLEYESLAKYLVENCKYPKEHLMKPVEEDADFMLKGLILDVNNGNVLRIDPTGHILHSSHGTREMTREEIKKYYGEECRWEITDIFSKNPLHTWNGPLSEEVRTLLDYFDMPAGLIFARAVDTLDEQNGNKSLEKYSIWPDILAALQHMFQKEHFQLEKGGYFPNLKNNPSDYIYKCSDNLLNWLKLLKDKKKILFLITGSNVDFASHTAENCMGVNWKDSFDIIIYFAKKPGFFTEDRPFIGLNGLEETDEISVDNLEIDGCYTHGNWKGLYEFLKKCCNKDDPKIIYIGDNIIQDVYAPDVHTECDTIAVCEELQAEGIFGHEQVHSEGEFLMSKAWGSYFHHQPLDKSTIWKYFISRHAKLCIPSLEYVANYPIDHDFSKPLKE